MAISPEPDRDYKFSIYFLFIGPEVLKYRLGLEPCEIRICFEFWNTKHKVKHYTQERNFSDSPIVLRGFQGRFKEFQGFFSERVSGV